MKIAIIGAGAAGLSAAFDLTAAGHTVTVYEAAPEVGGLAAGFKAPHWDWSLEKFYHHWFATDSDILKLADELGVRDKVIFPRPYTVLYHNGRFYPFDSIPTALLYPGLGWGLNKVRFGLVGLYLRFANNWQALEKVTLDEWMRKWAGDQVYEQMWQPMVIGKFGEHYAKQVNMAWMWARIHARTTTLGTFQGGFQAFMDVLAAAVRQRGGQIHLSTPVERIESQPDGQVALHFAGGQTATFDRLLATTSPALFAKLAPQLTDAERQRIADLKSMGAVVLVLALKQPLGEKYYWYNIPKSAGFPFLAVVDHTNYIPAEHYGGDHIVYCGDYLEPDHPYFDISAEELFQVYLPGLQRINPDFNADWVKDMWLWRTKYAQPVPLVNQSQRIPPLKTSLPGVWLASMSQVYPWDRGTNFAVEIGRRAAREMST